MQSGFASEFFAAPPQHRYTTNFLHNTHHCRSLGNTTQGNSQQYVDRDPWLSRVGAFLAFSAYQSASGNIEVAELYKIYERGEERLIASPDFIGRLLGHISSCAALMFIGGMILGATLCPGCGPKLGSLGNLFMAICYVLLFERSRSASRPTWISIAFIWLARLCLE